MRMAGAGLALLVAAGCGRLTEGSAAQAAGPSTLFEGATLIVGDGSAPIENSALLVEGRTIRGVG